MSTNGRPWAALGGAALLIGCVSGPAVSDEAGRSRGHADEHRVLVFSKTAGFRHDSIPEGVAAVRELGAAHGFAVDATEDSRRLHHPQPRALRRRGVPLDDG